MAGRNTGCRLHLESYNRCCVGSSLRLRRGLLSCFESLYRKVLKSALYSGSRTRLAFGLWRLRARGSLSEGSYEVFQFQKRLK